MAGKVDKIVCLETKKLLAAQSAVGVALRGSSLSIKVLAANAGLHPNSVAAYFPADANQKPTQISGGALLAVMQHLPSDLAPLLMPDGFHFVAAPQALDLDELAARCAEFLRCKGEAHHPDSPDGCDISAGETGELVVLAEQVKAAA